MAGSLRTSPRPPTCAPWPLAPDGPGAGRGAPYILKYDRRPIVVKYGGNAMTGTGGRMISPRISCDEQTGIDPVVVHAAAPRSAPCSKAQHQLDLHRRPARNRRSPVRWWRWVTGSINKQIVTGIQAAGGRAVGLSGKDGICDRPQGP